MLWATETVSDGNFIVDETEEARIERTFAKRERTEMPSDSTEIYLYHRVDTYGRPHQEGARKNTIACVECPGSIVLAGHQMYRRYGS